MRTGKNVFLPNPASATLSYRPSSMTRWDELKKLLSPPNSRIRVRFNTRRNGDNAAHTVMAAPRDRVSRFCRPAHEGTFLGSVLNSPDQAGTFITSQTCKGKLFCRRSSLPSSLLSGRRACGESSYHQSSLSRSWLTSRHSTALHTGAPTCEECRQNQSLCFTP